MNKERCPHCGGNLYLVVGEDDARLECLLCSRGLIPPRLATAADKPAKPHRQQRLPLNRAWR